MKKKNYILPTIEVLEMVATPILAGSEIEIFDNEEPVQNPLSKELGFDIFE